MLLGSEVQLLTAIMASIGAIKAHIIPSLVDSQQLRGRRREIEQLERCVCVSERDESVDSLF